MFTGIIEEVGTVLESGRGRLRIGCAAVLQGTGLGDSIAVNGVDLTVAHVDERSLAFDCMPETYRRSNLGQLLPGDPVNLERSLTLASRLSGHLVRGVVEATGTLLSLTPEEDAVIARYSAPPDILRHTVVKGPITVDGVSLTVIDKDESAFAVSLVQYTQEHTNLARRQPGDPVNLESDIIARYVDELLASGRGPSPIRHAGAGHVILFRDDERGYLAWLRANPEGFVVNSYRDPNPKYLMLHRATCRTINGAPARGRLWTKDYSKACSSNRDNLEAWATAETGGRLNPCDLCRP